MLFICFLNLALWPNESLHIGQVNNFFHKLHECKGKVIFTIAFPCPNCHAMVHRGNEAKPLSVEALRGMMSVVSCTPAKT